MDTYKVATVANSTSTMHKLASTPITLDCFEMDDFTNYLILEEEENPFMITINNRIGVNSMSMATINDKIGIFALRKILLIIPGNSKKCNELTKLIIENKYFQEILTDKTGNFLIKLILQKTKNKFFELIFLKIKDSVSILAKNKYASFVLEELINVANKKQLKEINKEFKDCKEILLKDNFGKYVMQTLNKKRYIIEHFS